MLLFAVLACVKQPSADTGRRLETGDTAQGDTGAAPEPPIGPCGPWSGVRRIGTRWNVRATQDYIDRFGWDGGGAYEVVDASAEHTVIHYAARFEGDEGWFGVDRTETWRCDSAGAWWLASDVKTEGRTSTADVGLTATRTFEPGWLVRPATMESGTTWSDSFEVTTDVEGVGTSTASVACTTRAEEEVDHTVAAGVFSAIHLAVDCAGFGAPQPWLAEGTGPIDDGDVELISYVP